MSFSELVRGASLRGSPQAPLDAGTAATLGRALGTLLRRRGLPLAVQVAWSEKLAAVRDGLVRGLLLSGCEVRDVGNIGSEELSAGLRNQAASGVYIGAVGGQPMMLSFLAGRSLIGEGLAELAALADDGVFSVGLGSLQRSA